MTDTDPVRHTKRAMALTGLLAAGTAAVLGSIALLGSPAPDAGEATTPARRITETFPVPAPEILGLLDRPADLGALRNPARLASCLTGLGYPGSTPVLGARRLPTAGRDVVLLVLAADTPRRLAAIVVPTTCSAADTGLLAETQVRQP